MRELYLVPGESSATSLVLADSAAAHDETAPDGEHFRLHLDAETAGRLRELIPSAPETDAQPATATAVSETLDLTGDPATEDPAPAAEEAAPRPEHAPAEPDPRLSAPLTMRPREIQDRVRAGASVAELAAKMGVTESRVEPFAHPVLLERSRIAELARRSHPVRDDGPAKLTLAEVLATAFTARGLDADTARWDAHREPGGQWVVSVTFSSGHSENTAEWTLQDHATSSSTTVARNAAATDLTDPESGRQVRTLRPLDGGAGEPDEPAAAPTAAPSADARPAGVEQAEADAASASETEDSRGEAGAEDGDTDFLRHPEPREKPAKRRRRAVTPHWEDVLLGVRTNTKRPRR